jgi:hypothetical protein
VTIWFKRLATPAAIVVLAAVLRVISGVGFVNYDTLYALAWGGQIARGSTPTYAVAIAPTPHPLIELLGVLLAPLGPKATVQVAVALAFLALAGCAWVIYALGARWFGRPAGALAALLFITRLEVLSYGVRAYIDVPYVLLVLGAVLVESRRPRAGAPVLGLLALAGLLRPEAWVFSGLYWLYLLDLLPRIEPVEPPAGRLGWRLAAPRRRPRELLVGDRQPASASHGPVTTVGSPPPPSRAHLARLTLLAASAPVLWLASDLAVTGNPLWSLTNTRDTAQILDRVTGIANVPEYIPRRIGEILRPPVLLGAAIGGVLSLLWLRERARLGAIVGVIAVLVFAAFATIGLPINTRYAFLASAILCIFCGAGVFGWTLLDHDDARRRWWMVGSLAVVVALVAFAPSEYRATRTQLDKLAAEQRIEDDLVALVRRHAIGLACGPVGVPNHAPIPLLALYLKTSPARIISAQVRPIASGTYLDPASAKVEQDYVLDPHDPHLPVSVPPGFTKSTANRSWVIFKRCT